MKHILYFTKRIHSFTGRILYINLFCMVLISLFEGVGIFLLVPLVNISGIFKINPSSEQGLSWLISFLHKFPSTISLILILAIFLGLIILQSLFQRKQTILSSKIQQGFIRHLREDTYTALLQANWTFYLNKRKSDIINIMTNELMNVSAGTNMTLQLMTSVLFTFIQLGIAFWLSVKLTLFVILFGLAIFLFSRKFVKKSNNLGKETYELSQAYIAGITDHFNGIKDIKSNMLEESHINWFQNLSAKMQKNRIELTEVNTISQLIYKIVSGLLIAAFVFISIKIFKAQSAQLMLIIVIFSRLWPKFSDLQSNMQLLSAIIPSFKALEELLKQSITAKELNETELHEVKPFMLKKGIECLNVNFRYNSAVPVYALNNINLNVPANHMTAIVGPSGAGKSTLIDLLMGLNNPETGRVLIDGNPLSNQNLLSLRRSISYVPQDPFLFNGTIKENLLIIDSNATEEQIWNALEFAEATDFVRRLPNSLDTFIGDRGIKLSGGERQRLVLARAILRKPSILVLDEATSALDTENEAKIQEALEKLKGSMTIIVIAHRLSTIRNADQVIVLDQGEIIQRGPFSQLANERKGMFNSLLRKQMEISV